MLQIIAPQKKIQLDFISLELYENYVVASIFEGKTLDLEKLEILHEIFEENYPNTLFGYISNRVFDYSINPICYSEVTHHPNMVGMAVYCHKESSFNTANFEKAFCKVPFEPFYSMKECQKYISQLLENKK